MGFERAGMRCAWQIEIDPYCRAVLRKHWPTVRQFCDVQVVHGEQKNRCNHCLDSIDLLCGGPPCQPFSYAGKRRGAKDPRNLWPDTVRLVEELRPRWIVFENVPGVESYLATSIPPRLEAQGYRNSPIGIVLFSVPAWSVGAFHLRHRIWTIAYRSSHLVIDSETSQSTDSDGARYVSTKFERHFSRLSSYSLSSAEHSGSKNWKPEPDVVRMVHGIRSRLDRARIRALGNAVVPQVAQWIAKTILSFDRIYLAPRAHRAIDALF